MRRWLFIGLTALFFCSSLWLGKLYLGERNLLKEPDKYPLLSNSLFLKSPGDTTINFEPLRENVKNYLAQRNINHSFYFEYLSTGTNIRDGSETPLVGASLLKIPIVMDLYKASEEGKTSLDKKVTVPANAVGGNDPTYGNESHLKAGQQIELGNAAKIALTESDNTAAYTVFNATSNLLPSGDQSLNNLDVETTAGTSSAGNLVYISARSSSSILKCLYYSCFLKYGDSQAILNDLNNGSGDNSRIRAGVPKNIVVARKIGSFSDVTQSDCGIVYVPNKNYVMCVMLDENSAAADKDIKALSQMVYKYINSL